jgi:hypothetical protein
MDAMYNTVLIYQRFLASLLPCSKSGAIAEPIDTLITENAILLP